MRAWLALMKKDFRLGLPVFLVAVIMFAGSITFSYFVGDYYGIRNGLLLIAFGFVIIIHIFFLLFYLFYSLNYERKMLHLWLHNPMSIAGLLSSKVLTGLIYMLITFSFCIFLFYQTFENWYVFANFVEFNNFVGIIVITVFYVSLFLASSFLLFWSVFLTLSQRINDFLSFVLAILIFSFVSYLYQTFIGLDFIQSLTNWGSIEVNDVWIGFEFSRESFSTETSSSMDILYMGQIIRDLLAALVMFLITCYIIEKKVEV